MKTHRLVIMAGKKDFFLPLIEYELWEMSLFQKVDPAEYAYLDVETSRKIQELQHETVEKINNLIKENLDKTVLVTKEDMKNFKVE